MDIDIICHILEDQRAEVMDPFVKKCFLKFQDAAGDTKNCFLSLFDAFQKPLTGFDFFVYVFLGQASVVLQIVTKALVITADPEPRNSGGVQRDLVLALILVDVDIGYDIVMRRSGHEGAAGFRFQ